jgi:preprotein translocase subunit SecY
VKVNPAGVIPAIFASSLLLLPTTLTTFGGGQTSGPVMGWILANFGPGSAALPAVLRLDDRLLHVFLYAQRVLQDRGRGR